RTRATLGTAGDDLTKALGVLVQLLDEPRDGTVASPDEVKRCCAAVYGLELVGTFLGDSYHPGGSALTRRLADALDLRPDPEVLGVVWGVGTTACVLAQDRGVKVTGIDLWGRPGGQSPGTSQPARTRQAGPVRGR